MHKLTLFFVLFFASVFQANASLPERCYNPSLAGCSFYTDCLEAKYSCGQKGYALNEGGKYCSSFAELNTLSEKGKRWRDAALRCLQQQLYPLLDADWKISCKGVRTFAHRTHPTCYTMPGNSICSLPLSDLKKIASIFKAADPSEISFDSFSQVIQIIKNCKK
jgi:hypothetical protein